MITTRLKGIELFFETNSTVFSPKSIDLGTLAMLSVMEFQENDKVLDLGCGYGVVGILAAKLIGDDKVFMVDIDGQAVQLARQNASLNHVEGLRIMQSDGLNNLDETGFTMILSNPPYHTDFSVAKSFIEKGFNRLLVGGRMVMVTKRKAWYQNKLTAIFGGVKVWEIDGYYVFMSVKKSSTYANANRNKRGENKSTN